MELVRGYLQPYAWGAEDGLADWAGVTGGPQAELWFGTHPNGPSPLLDGTGTASVPQPILTKLLAAGRPLSIQIHPPEPTARRIFERQLAEAASPQLLSDPYGKAEILIAIAPFDILEGFRDPREAADVFARLGSAFASVTEALAADDLPQAIRILLQMPAHDVPKGAASLPGAMLAAGIPQYSAEVMRTVVESFPGDPGVFVAGLLNARKLQPGEAVYVDPGTVHAYVRGVGLEVMTNSDNVLRLGLTHKTVAVDAALDALSLDAQPHPCQPEEQDGVTRYAPPGAPFVVRILSEGTSVAESGTARTLLCLSGTMTVGPTTLLPGQALLAAVADADLLVAAEGMCVIAQQAPDPATTTG